MKETIKQLKKVNEAIKKSNQKAEVQDLEMTKTALQDVAKEELDESHNKLNEFVDKQIPKSFHNQFYELLNKVILNEIEMEQFCE